ncbi:MAG TPA: adenylyl-sulfate kinase [Rhodospirillaceae bacterium]|nr:adenylyl-sulfate kinase [Rhodospirillaceae bacterium]
MAAAMKPADRKPVVKIVFAGHVDHGKSTLLGRLLTDLRALPEGKMESVAESCKRRGVVFEWAFLLDALRAERDQGITIDSTQVQAETDTRRFVFIDAPGHHEFIKNMVTGAAQADAAVLLVDAKDGLQAETQRHAFLLGLLGIRDVIVAVTKMDLVGYDQARFDDLAGQVTAHLASLGFDADRVKAIPVAARDGENILTQGGAMPWHSGPALIEHLDALVPGAAEADAAAAPLRFIVQGVYKFDERRILAGRILSGSLSVGDEILFSPGNRRGRVKSIETWPTPADRPTRAETGQSVGITLDQQSFIERGAVGAHPDTAPHLINTLRGRIVWFGAEPLTPGARYKMKLNAGEYLCIAETIEHVLNAGDLSKSTSATVSRNQIADVVFRSRGHMAADAHGEAPQTGRFVLVADHRIVGCGLIDLDGFVADNRQKSPKSDNIMRVEHRIDMAERWSANGHKSGILWFTGLSGSGKSTLAVRLEEALFRRGKQVFVLDGDNVRHGLCADLGFSPDDRQENIRRVGELAQILAHAGFIVVTAFISPYRADRDGVRARAGDLFHEIHVAANLEVCEQRDPKGLYKKARTGEIPEFTGVSAPYEAPHAPELVIDTAILEVDACVERLVDYALAAFEA